MQPAAEIERANQPGRCKRIGLLSEQNWRELNKAHQTWKEKTERALVQRVVEAINQQQRFRVGGICEAPTTERVVAATAALVAALGCCCEFTEEQQQWPSVKVKAETAEVAVQTNRRDGEAPVAAEREMQRGNGETTSGRRLSGQQSHLSPSAAQPDRSE